MNERRMRSGACRAAAIASFAASLLLVPVRARSADPDASLGGRITGTVLDPKGNPVAGAPVEASGAAPAAPRTSATDARGKFRFDGLPPGRYRIRAGDAHCVLGADVEVEAGRESVVEGVLGAGCRREKVDVAAPAPRYSAIDATTATKTDTPIMETPVSVQVVPQQVLQDQQATRLDKAVQNVSGVIPVTAGFQSSDDYVIRGFDNFAVSYENGLKLDEYTVSGFYRDMANVERVEIVKGPASVLYGQAEPGGLVNVVTKKPLDAPRYAFELQAGSFGTYRGTIDATGPLNEAHSLLYRLNLSYENAGSFRDFVSGERFFVFPTLQWKPGAADEVTLELKYANGFVIGDNGVPFAADGRPADVPVSRNYAEPDANRAPTTEYALKLGATHDFGSGWSLRAAYRLEYRKSPTPNGQFYQGPADENGDLGRWWLTEDIFYHWTQQGVVDLTGKFDAFGLRHTLILGADLYHLQGKYDYNQTGFVTPPPSINIYNPVYGQPFPPLDPTQAGFTDQHQTSWGVYVQDQIELPGRLHVLVGGRFDRADTFNSGYGDQASEVHDHPPITPRVGVLWRATPQLSPYVSYTSNYGTTPLGVLTRDGNTLPAQSAQQLEAGLKLELFDKRLSATTSVYQLTKQNIPTADPTNPAFTIAIGEARSRGVELDVRGEVLPGWDAIIAYAYTDVRTTRDNNGFEGQRFAGVPYNSLTLWSTLQLPTGPLKGLRLGAGVVARDYEAGVIPGTAIPGFGVVNAMASYEWFFGSTRWRAQLNAENLFDRGYFSALTYNAATPGSPRSFLGALRLDF